MTATDPRASWAARVPFGNSRVPLPACKECRARTVLDHVLLPVLASTCCEYHGIRTVSYPVHTHAYERLPRYPNGIQPENPLLPTPFGIRKKRGRNLRISQYGDILTLDGCDIYI